ncbi:MAG TPA: twin-arginine translocase subunit TatC [Fimbriimonadaceae bacterium]|nr:twin-arginine translocase subunit TatC [Fimbriimonadaceae bacterium]HRJ34124.1 twin-arginine translocase subunit TatC [Fimbriimonadaceae bacterium]
MRLGSRESKSKRNFSDPEEFRLPLGDHLEELRTRLVRVLLLLVGGWVVGWFLHVPVYAHLQAVAEANLIEFKKTLDIKEAFRNFADPFMLKLRLSFFIGLVLVLPFVVGQLWGFVSPALKPHEKKPLKVAVPLSIGLFAMGATFCWLIIPSALNWFMSYLQDYAGAALYQEPGTLVFFILKMMLAFGLGFQLPILVFVLAKIGILGPQTLSQYWKQATVIIFFLAGLITPSNDIPSMLMMAIPLTLLFFVSVWAVRISDKRARKKNPERFEDEYLE